MWRTNGLHYRAGGFFENRCGTGDRGPPTRRLIAMRIGIDATGWHPAVLPAQGYRANVKLIAIGDGMSQDLMGVKRPVCWSMRNCTILLLKTFAPNR